MPETQKGKDLAKRWGLTVEQALYRKTGDWYHQLKRFPGALLDADGYVIFESEEAFNACPQIRLGKDPTRHGGWVDAPLGIKAIPGYVEADRSPPTGMALVLVQNPVIMNAGYAWKDIEGHQYHFPNQYKNRCRPGTPFVYYRGTRRPDSKRAVPEYFGTGTIGTVWRDESIPETSPKKDWAWYCEVLDYRPFQSPVPAKINGSFIETIARNHWSVGVRLIPQESFDRILLLAGIAPSEPQAIIVPEVSAVTIEEADVPLLVPHAAGLGSGRDGPSARYSRTAAVIGRRAEEVAHRFLSERSATIGVKNLRWVACDGLTPGWDIQYNDLAGQIVAVEVKGATGARFASIDLTAGEWKAAAALGDRYWLYLVANCLSANPRIQRIQNPAKIVAEGGAQLMPIAYRLAVFRDPKASQNPGQPNQAPRDL